VRLALAIGVIAVAWAAAIYIHQRHTLSASHFVTSTSSARSGGGYGSVTTAFTGRDSALLAPVREHPSWEDPLAVLLAIGGVAIAVRVGLQDGLERC